MSKLKILSYVLLGLGAILFFFLLFSTGDMTAKHYAENPDAGIYSTLEIFLIWTYILAIAAVVLALVLPLINIIRDPKNIRKMFTNLGILVAVVLVSYFLASSDALPTSSGAESSPMAWKISEAFLIATYILLIVAVGAIIVGGVMGIIKKR